MATFSTLIVVLACIATAMATSMLSKSDSYESRSAIQRGAVLIALGVAIGFVAMIGTMAQQNSMLQVVTLVLLASLVVVHFARGDATEGDKPEEPAV